MDFNAFQQIQDALSEELEKQGFSAPEPFGEEENCQAVTWSMDGLAYGLFYDKTAQRFELRSTTVDAEGAVGSWRSLSVWLFDREDGTREDAESILNDFLEVIRGPKRVAAIQQKRKSPKGDERSVDPLFFLNRLVNIFPELKDELNEERIVYGQVRPVTFIKERVVPKCEDLANRYADSDPMKKLCALMDDMYKNGDMDLRSVLTHSLLNSLSDGAFGAFAAAVGEELGNDLKYTRRLKDKKIKPEKKKKHRKVEARLE